MRRKNRLALPVINSRGCPDCGCGMEPVQLMGASFTGYRKAPALRRSRWWRFWHRDRGGRIAAWLCPGCSRIVMYAAPAR